MTGFSHPSHASLVSRAIWAIAIVGVVWHVGGLAPPGAPRDAETVARTLTSDVAVVVTPRAVASVNRSDSAWRGPVGLAHPPCLDACCHAACHVCMPAVADADRRRGSTGGSWVVTLAHPKPDRVLLVPPPESVVRDDVCPAVTTVT